MTDTSTKCCRSASQQKRAEKEEQYGAIDYDAPIEPKSGSVGMGTKVTSPYCLTYLSTRIAGSVLLSFKIS